MNRYLDIQAQGVVDWLCSPPESPAQKVFAGLLRLSDSAVLVPAQLAEQFGLNLQDFSRALFELNRRQSVQVIPEPQNHADELRADFALLCADLGDLAAQAQPLLLASNDGLCLAQQGLAEEACIKQAAECHRGENPQFPHVLPLHLSSGLFRLCSPAPIRTSHAALLRLARRLSSLLGR